MGTVLTWIGVVALPTAVGYAVLAGRRVYRWHQARRPASPPEPIEQLVADLRRLHDLVDATEAAPRLPAKRLRCTAARAAYVDALTAACRRLDVPPPGGQPVPWTEIYRVESDLRRRGVDVRTAG